MTMSFLARYLEALTCLVLGPVLMWIAWHGYENGTTGRIELFGRSYQYAQAIGPGSPLMLGLGLVGIFTTLSGIIILIRKARRKRV